MELNTAIDVLVKYIQELNNKYWERMNFTHSKPPTITFTNGKRYVRIVKNDVSSKSVWGFVDTTDGKVYYPAGWAAPSKNTPARGNVFNPETWGGFTEHSPQYLRGGM